MTTVAEIITDAYRQGNLLAIGTTPTEAQQTEGLRYLNRVVKSVFGNEAGDPLTAFPIGREDISRPSGYPYYNTVPDNDWFVPENLRVMLNLDQGGVNLYLHPNPNDGARFAAIDVAGTLATYPVTVYGNGRRIEGLTSIALNENGYDAEWFYRADTGNWQKYSPLALDDTFPFPEEFDFFFIIQLAMTINPTYGIQMDGQTGATFQRAKSQIRARYTQTEQIHSELGLIRPSKMVANQDRWRYNYYGVYDPNTMFNSGNVW